MSEYKITIDINEAYRFLGGRGSPDEESRIALEKASDEVLKIASPRVIKKICKLRNENGFYLEGTDIKLQGKSISALLHNCDSCAIFCATLGTGVDTLIRQWQLRELAFAATLDACANCAVESLCNIINEEIKSEYCSIGQFVTDRFSPGYGDFPLELQGSFCAVLDTQRKIGVAVGDSGLMIPLKSVTALIGISKQPQQSRDTGCADCIKLDSCAFRERGITCYGQTV